METRLRYALILGSTKSIHQEKSLDATLLNERLSYVSDALASLGPYSFVWPNSKRPKKLINPTYQEVHTNLDKAVSDGKAIDLFLLYYLGHGDFAPNLRDHLLIAYRNLNLSHKDLTDFTLNGTAQAIANRGIKRLIIVADCCRSGLVHPSISLALPDCDYYMMSSTGTTPQDIGIGKIKFPFSYALADSLMKFNKIPQLEDKSKGGVTFSKWFSWTKNQVGNQLNPLGSGTLGNEMIVPIQLAIADNLNIAAPPKSQYMKLYELLRLLDENQGSVHELAREIKARRIVSFQLIGFLPGTRQPAYVSEETLAGYLRYAELFGLAASSKNGIFSITEDGHLAVANSGALFNKYIYERVFEILPKEVNANQILSVLNSIIEKRIMPDLMNIEREFQGQAGIPRFPRKRLRIAMRLLAYSGLLRRATPDTYFIV